MKVLFLLTKRQPPSTRIRVTSCFDRYEQAGIECTGFPIPSGLLGRLQVLRKAAAHDIIVLQKKTSFKPYELKLLKWVNPKIIFDFDDAVMFHEAEHLEPLRGKHFLKFIRTINACHTVVAGNRFLARFSELNAKRVKVLPTPVDMTRVEPKVWDEHPERIIIGWVGVARNLYYLKRLQPVLQALCSQYPQLHLMVVSNDTIEMEGVRVINERWTQEKEARFLAQFDVGIMPLDDDLWSWGKCGYKILQYFGAGVPAVASPVGINTDFIKPDVNGYLAHDTQQWHAALSKLIESFELRKKLGLQGFNDVQEKYSQQVYSDTYIAIMKQVFDDA